MSTAYRAGREGKPRVIRKVMKMGRDGRPKMARDRKTLIQMERVTAQAPRQCAYHGCKHVFTEGRQGGWIATGTEYAKVTSPLWGRRSSYKRWPETRDYHFECVPPEARPLVRFFVSRNA